jgi:alpha-glutamyl/putrescinyl thymine pyrophosphorylase clade 1
MGAPTLAGFDARRYGDVLNDAFRQGQRLYSPAYVMPSPPFGADRKHDNHLRLLDYMMDDGIASKLTNAQSMCEAFEIIKSYPSVGDFLAFQFLIDINYSSVYGVVVAGPAGVVPVVPADAVDVEQFAAELFGEFDGHAEVPGVFDVGLVWWLVAVRSSTPTQSM